MTHPTWGQGGPPAGLTNTADSTQATWRDGIEWRCVQCNVLLGRLRGNRLHVKYKKSQLVVDGGNYIVTVVCPKCSQVNEHSGERDMHPPSVPSL